MNKRAHASSRPAPASQADLRLLTDDDTIPSTPYTPRTPYAPPGASSVYRRAVGDPAGEHRIMRRGRFAAWPHVGIAFLYLAAIAGAVCAVPAWLVASSVAGDDQAGIAALVAFA